MLTNLQKKLHHYFLPHESNNFRAKTLHNSSVVFYILLIISFQLFMSFYKRVNPNILGFATDISVDKILNLVNQKRIEANLQPLAISNKLSIAATSKGNDMFSKDYWAHISPTGTTPWVFINSAGYEYIYAGENLARNFNTAEEVVDAWMNSSTHRANLLKAEYNDIGLAVINGRLNGEDTTLVVQEFGTPSKSAVAQVPASQQEVNVLPEKKQIAPVQTSVLAEKQSNMQINNLVLPYINKSISLIVAEFLLVILFIDSIYLWRTKTSRLSSHSLAHIIFFGALLGAMGATGIGSIL